MAVPSVDATNFHGQISCVCSGWSPALSQDAPQNFDFRKRQNDNMTIVSASTILGAIMVFLHSEVMAALRDPMHDRIIDGEDPSEGEFPSFAAGVGCGGTLIHEDIVLTAARCNANGFFAFDDFVQIGGTISPWLYDYVELDGVMISTVCAVNHPQFIPEAPSKGYDIALVKLSHPSDAPLIGLNFDPAVPLVHELVTTVGYGILGYKERIPGDDTTAANRDTLQVLSPLFIQSMDFCSSSHGDFNADFHLCTNDFDPDTTTCNGDTGGPILNENGVQVGILSFGNFSDNGECLGNTPDYWTNVAKFEAFIKEGICGRCSMAAAVVA
jgi:trypsin